MPRRGPLAWVQDSYRLGIGALTAAVGLFLGLRLTAWPPHEDETLVFFVARRPLPDLLESVFERGGAPLHYLLAHISLSFDESLVALRLVSAIFAVASIPVLAALVARLAGRRTALLAALLSAASWTFLFHGIYGRMYGLFLFLSALSCLLLLRALERGSGSRWVAWAAAALAVLATQPYGALMLLAQGVFVGLLRLRGRTSLRRPGAAAAAVLVLATPLWITYSHLASRFEVGVGPGTASELGSPLDVLAYLWEVLGDFTAGWPAAAIPVALVALAGLVVLARRRPDAALFAGAIVVVPALALMVTRAGSGLVPETRHLLFVLPFFAMALAASLLEVARHAGRLAPLALGLGLAALIALQLAWGWEKTPWLYAGEPEARAEGRSAAADWLAATGRRDDVLFGYEPTYLDARTEGAPFGTLFVPRADPELAVEMLRDAGEPLGRGVWVLDASDAFDPSEAPLSIPERVPGNGFEARAFGPFLVVRTREPTGQIEEFFRATLEVESLGEELGILDAGLNYSTAETALELLEAKD
ncbi:MAG TPA: glycosyltransferase family 39 protein [Gaiellaceae bacterium]|nr:glycosyltransferase family 39 protein [Gaiellaceae bacterium]